MCYAVMCNALLVDATMIHFYVNHVLLEQDGGPWFRCSKPKAGNFHHRFLVPGGEIARDWPNRCLHLGLELDPLSFDLVTNSPPGDLLWHPSFNLRLIWAVPLSLRCVAII